MEYITNRKEIVIKKVLGYSLFARFKEMYLSTLFTGIAGMITAIVIIVALKLSYGWFIIGTMLLLFLIELVYVTLICVGSEVNNIQRVLKNGV